MGSSSDRGTAQALKLDVGHDARKRGIEGMSSARSPLAPALLVRGLDDTRGPEGQMKAADPPQQTSAGQPGAKVGWCNDRAQSVSVSKERMQRGS